MKAKYRLFIDEYGSSGYRSEKSEKYFFLVGVAIELGQNVHLNDAVASFKKKQFEDFDLGEPPTLHWVEVIKDRYEDEAFFSDWVDVLKATDFTLFVVGINKEAYYKRRLPNPIYETYSYLLTCMIERYCYLLESKGETGDVYAESRGRQENSAVKNKYRSIYEDGIIMGSRTSQNSAWVQGRLSNKNINLRNKDKGVVGLEVADFFAKPASLFLSSFLDLQFRPYPSHFVYTECKDLLEERLYKKDNEILEYGLKFFT